LGEYVKRDGLNHKFTISPSVRGVSIEGLLRVDQTLQSSTHLNNCKQVLPVSGD
jgi:hypothetical protein